MVLLFSQSSNSITDMLLTTPVFYLFSFMKDFSVRTVFEGCEIILLGDTSVKDRTLCCVTIWFLLDNMLQVKH